MNDLRKAAEMALKQLQRDDVYLGHRSKTRADAIEALRQALAEPEQYDQTALELCEKCGWKAIMPDEGCLVCAREEDKTCRRTPSGS